MARKSLSVGTEPVRQPEGRQAKRAEGAPRPTIGRLLRERRAHHGWTLADVSDRTGVSKSALSKIENDLMSPTYHTIIQLCSGLDVEIGDLIAPGFPKTAPAAVLGRRSISRQHEGASLEDGLYKYSFLCADVAHKRIIPMVVEVKANAFEQIQGLWAHVGEEFIYVLQGEIELYTEFYEPVRLSKDDSCYFDSSMQHAYLSTQSDGAMLLVAYSSATPNLAQTLRDVLRTRLAGNIPFDPAERVSKGGKVGETRQHWVRAKG